MKTYRYAEKSTDGKMLYLDVTEEQILEVHWPFWSVLTKSTLTRENCLTDWLRIFWAWEIK